MKNFYPSQYNKNSKLKLNHSYLIEQFSDYSKIFKKLEKVVKKGDYTLGNQVDVFEKNYRAVQRVQGILFMRKNASHLHLNSIFEVDGIGRRLHISAATAATTTAPAITIMLTHFEWLGSKDFVTILASIRALAFFG